MKSTEEMTDLIAKYNVAAPRYTSYPTMPYWDQLSWSQEAWLEHVRARFDAQRQQGISLYLHLPFCESLCTYCGCNTRITTNHGVEDPYIADLLAEWRMYLDLFGTEKPIIRELHLGGGTPTFFSPENLERLIAGLLEHTATSDERHFSFEGHPNSTSLEHLKLLHRFGFSRLSLGVQDFDPDVQRIINRKQTEEDLRRVMDDARAVGYTSVNFDLVFGLPLQTRDSIRTTVEKSLALQPDRISFYSYAHVPWLKPAQRMFTKEMLPVGEAKSELYQIGKSLILDAGYRDVGMDHFALPHDALFKASVDGSLHRNFMGYTEMYTPLLLGLGVSSISDTWTAFAQNVKSVEEYRALVRAGEFPLAKGHVLTEEDLALRRHILDIMCKGATELAGEGPVEATAILSRLQPVRQDGLVAIDGHRVAVTELGWSFLRNICMAFDQRLHDKRTDNPIFSQAV